MQIIYSTIQTVSNYLPENPLPARDRVTEIALSALKIVIHYSTRIISLYGGFIVTANLPSVPAVIILFLSTWFLGCLYIRPLTHDASSHFFNHILIKDGCLPTWMLKLNLFLGMDPNAKSGSRTMLENAVQSGNIPIARFLIKSEKVYPNLLNGRGNSPLHEAIKLGNIKMTRLLANSPSVNCDLLNRYGNRPLHCALDKNNAELLNILLGCSRVSCNLPNKRGMTPLFYAIHKNNAKLLKILVNCPEVKCDLSRNSNNNIYDELPLNAVLRKNTTELLDVFIDCASIDLNKPCFGGRTPLYQAILSLRDDPEFVCKLLKSERVEVDLISSMKGSPGQTSFQLYVSYIEHYLKDVIADTPCERVLFHKYFKHWENIVSLFIAKGANFEFLKEEEYKESKKLLMPLINEKRNQLVNRA